MESVPVVSVVRAFNTWSGHKDVRIDLGHLISNIQRNLPRWKPGRAKLRI